MPWMTQLFNTTDPARGPFQLRPLNRITLPGTHDSGCYVDQTWSNFLSKTQMQDIGTQLQGGIRYFDIRPKFLGNGQFVTYHGGLYEGGMLTGAGGILQQIQAYFAGLQANDRELAILNISHFSNFSPAAHNALITAITATLGNILVQHRQGAINLFDAPYHSLLRDANATMRSRVVVLYDGALDTPIDPFVTQAAQNGTLPPGFFTVAPKYISPANNIFLFDQYSNRANLDNNFFYTGMKPDQFDKLIQRDHYDYAPNANWVVPHPFAPNWTNNAPLGVASTMHLLSWTLTPQFRGGEPIWYADHRANPFLADFFSDPARWANGTSYDATKDPQVNIIYVDHYESLQHNNPLSIWNGLAMPVAIAARMNVGAVGNPNTW
ncbi:hypothetical protein [Dyella acidiphila]|uniref:Phosphatidylinositol diacylglycerol-lyase n=1 Tax=Dyella acidiphila TaxID=2775866 RepID=A0ABR9GAV2_9GAMM|nr:hypothetical protein [Dyella acidiphila]MBE1161149.1 hypothetical protein [Dyella acidiphila]